MGFLRSSCCISFESAVILMAIGGLFPVPAIWNMALCVVVPLLLSFSIRRFLADYDYRDHYVDAHWHPDEDA